LTLPGAVSRLIGHPIDTIIIIGATGIFCRSFSEEEQKNVEAVGDARERLELRQCKH
jgi:dihydrodipicolinate synthase/N-acetylneuraminate lyase